MVLLIVPTTTMSFSSTSVLSSRTMQGKSWGLSLPNRSTESPRRSRCCRYGHDRGHCRVDWQDSCLHQIQCYGYSYLQRPASSLLSLPLLLLLLLLLLLEAATLWTNGIIDHDLDELGRPFIVSSSLGRKSRPYDLLTLS